MKPTVIMVRHGATKYDPPVAKKDIIAGWHDLPLAPEGRAEGWTVANYLADQPIAKIWTSSLRRAVATGQMIKAAHPDKPPLKDVLELRPQQVGDYTHKLEEDVKDDLLFYQIAAPTRTIPGGESTEAHLNRLLPFVADRFDDAERAPNAGAVVLVHHSRNFPLIKGWWQNGMKGTDVDPAAIREGTQVQPGEMAIYTKEKGKWQREVVPFQNQAKAA